MSDVTESEVGDARAQTWRRPGLLLWLAVLVAGFVFGALAFRESFVDALTASQTAGSQRRYTFYWIGMALFLVPAIIRLLQSKRVTLTERYLILIAIAIFTYIPRVLRSPVDPLYFDELAHWVQSENLARTGDLFQPSLVYVIQFYPGLHALTVSLSDLTGLGTYTIGLFVGGLSHVLEMVGVFILTRRLFNSFRVGSFAAVVYAANPGFLLFTAQYAYETLALIFVTWVIVFMGELSNDTISRSLRRRWAAVIIVLTLGTAVTHHLSSLFLLGVLVLNAIAARPWKNWRQARLAVAAAVFAVIANSGWIGVRGTEILSYLAPFPQQGFEQLLSFFEHGDPSSASGSRQAFSGSVLPRYETLLAFVCPVLVTGAILIGSWANRRLWKKSSVFKATLLVALCYPLSMPLVLTTSGAPGAHRSWPFSYVAVSVFVAAAWAALFIKKHPSPAPTKFLGRIRALPIRVWRSPLVAISVGLAMISVLFLGNSGSENNDANRFPGPWAPITDARTASPELISLAEWTKETQAPGHVFLSDNATGGVFGAFSGNYLFDSFPTWDYFFYDARPKEESLQRIKTDKIEYLLIDHRLAEASGDKRPDYYFVPGEPSAFTRDPTITDASLDKFERYPWATKIYQTRNYSLYKLNGDAIDSPVLGEVAR